VVQITKSFSLKGALVAMLAWVANAVVAEIAAVVVTSWPCWAGTGASLVPVDGQLSRCKLLIVCLVTVGPPSAASSEVVVVAKH